MKTAYAEYFNKHKHNFYKGRRFKYYLLINSQAHLDYLCFIYEETKSPDWVTDSQKQGGIFFKKGFYSYLIIFFTSFTDWQYKARVFLISLFSSKVSVHRDKYISIYICRTYINLYYHFEVFNEFRCINDI